MLGLGGTFTPGQIPTEPGIFINVGVLGETKPDVVQGVAAALFDADWGPLTPQWLDGLQQAADMYGTAAGVEIPKEALRGKARRVRALRAGTGGTVGTKTLTDDAAVNAVRVDLAYKGTKAFGYTLTDNVVNPTTLRDLTVYENTAGGYVKRQAITFTKGATGIGEPAQLVAAIAALNAGATPERLFVVGTKLADGSKVLATVSAITAFTAGTNPTANGAAYDAAMATMAAEPWNVLALNTEDTAIQASAAQYIADLEADGVRRMLSIGEPTSVAFDTRRAHAAAFNRWNIVYTLNGFTSGGVNIEGAKAAARRAGLIAANGFRRSVLGQEIAGAVDLVDALDTTEWRQAIQSGAAAFVKDPFGNVVDGYGVTTYVTSDGLHSDAWKKILAVQRMYRYLDLVALAWWTRITGGDGIPNTDSGRATMTGEALGVMRDMELVQQLQPGGTAYLDPSTPPAGDAAAWVFEVSVADNIEKLLATARFA